MEEGLGREEEEGGTAGEGTVGGAEEEGGTVGAAEEGGGGRETGPGEGVISSSVYSRASVACVGRDEKISPRFECFLSFRYKS